MPIYDLELRTYRFAHTCRDFATALPKNMANFEYAKQLIRSSGSQAANYIEANEAMSKKDFLHRVHIAMKEIRESGLWLSLCQTNNDSLEQERLRLAQEAVELRKIFGAIFAKGKIYSRKL